MRTLRKYSKSFALIMTVTMFLVSVPLHSALAALVTTESVLDGNRDQNSKDRLIQLLEREEVRSALIAQGIDPQEAKARIASLTDSEINEISNQIENLPAGQGAIGLAIGVLLIILLVVVIARLI